MNYTNKERELLSIAETLKDFHTIILGHRITVYTDHKNLIFENFTTEKSATLAPYVGIIRT